MFMKKKIFVGLLALCLIGLLIFVGCRAKKADADLQSMEQIHQSSGVPVKAETVRVQEFRKVFKYSATLEAKSEAVRYSRVSDVVQNVYFKVGDYVHENQTVVEFPKNVQTTQYYQLKAAYDLARQTYNRMQELYKEGVISKQELDNAQANYEVARANLNTADDLLRVKAPLSGYITRLNVKPTDNVSSGEPLFTVSNLDRIEARMWASSQEIEAIKVGQKVTVVWDGKEIVGSITQISKILDPNKKAFEVRALFNNKDHVLTSGITTDVTIEVYRNPQAVVVDRKNLITENGKHYVYIVNDDVAVKKEVEIGNEQGNVVEIKSGLAPGELLITEGSKMVTNRAKIKRVNS